MGEVRRVYVEKKKDYAVKAKELHASLKQYLGLDVESVRVLVRYDIENLSDASYEKALVTVFSEPPVDDGTASMLLRRPTALLWPCLRQTTIFFSRLHG